jgi:phage shock protein A
MAESLSTRVSQIIVGSVHALMDKIEDQAPEAMMEQAIRQVDVVTEEVRHEFGIATANRHLAQQQHADLSRRHLELTSSADEAVSSNRDDLARAAITKQLDLEAQMPIIEKSLQNLAKQEKELASYIDALTAKKREMQEAMSAFQLSRTQVGSANHAGPGATQTQAKVEEASYTFGRILQRQTRLSIGDHKISIEETAKLKELDDLVHSKKVEERMAQLRAKKA